MAQYDVFLSYSHKNQQVVNQVYDELLTRGLRVWKDDGQLLVGDYLVESIQHALLESSLFVCFTSRAYKESAWCQHEIRVKIDQEVQQNRISVLPVRLDDSEIDEILKGKIWLDFYSQSYNESLQDLLRAIFIHLDSRQSGLPIYFDDPKSLKFAIWTPQRAYYWSQCKKMFWYEFIVPTLTYQFPDIEKRKILALSHTPSLAKLVGRITRREMRYFLRKHGVRIDNFKKLMKNQIQHMDEWGRLLEFYNGNPLNSITSERIIDQALLRYSNWRKLAGRYIDWQTKFRSSYYRYSTSTYTIFAKHKPFAIEPPNRNGRVLILENHDDDYARRKAKSHLYYYLLGRYDLVLENESLAIDGDADIIYLDSGEREEVHYSREDLLKFRNQLIARAQIFYNDRLAHAITAKPSSSCRYCKYLSVCDEGKRGLASELAQEEIAYLDGVQDDEEELD
jgi:hypothetical protein